MSEINVAVVGASGVVGRALLEHLHQSNIQVTGLSRRPPADLTGPAFVPLDLMDAEQCKALAAGELRHTTHLVYTALFEKPGLIAGWQEQDQMQTNLNMLSNLLAPLADSGALRHVTLLQGTKAYGVHVAPMKIPGLEREPRHAHDNFYWLQEDYLKEIAARAGWSHTIWRPQIIIGHALHAPMNILAALGVYAALQKQRNQPFSFPGGPGPVTELICADLLARAITFSFDNPAFAGETFNITNGDVCRWSDLWPALAEIFGMSPGEPDRRLLSPLYEQEALWSEITREHGLQDRSIRALVGDSFHYADALLNTFSDTLPPPALLSTIKLRQAGFHECIDTTEMFRTWFGRLADLKVLPPLT